MSVCLIFSDEKNVAKLVGECEETVSADCVSDCTIGSK